MEFLDDDFQSLLCRCGAFLLFVFAIKYCGKIVRFIQGENESQEDKKPDYTGCEAPGCVRCRRRVHNSLPDSMDEVESWRVRKWLESRDEVSKSPVLFELPGLNEIPFVDACHHMNDVEILERNWQVIKDECIQIIGGAFNQEQSSCGSWKLNLTPDNDGGWSVFYLFNQGREWEDNSRLCPKTMEILDELNDVLDNCSFGNVAFSVLLPNTTIPAHHGPTNTRSRCHLGLQIPPECSLFVDGREKKWEEGKCLLFNDSFLHSVEYKPTRNLLNNNDQLRIIFMIDLWNFDLSMNERSAIQQLYPPQ